MLYDKFDPNEANRQERELKLLQVWGEADNDFPGVLFPSLDESRPTVWGPNMDHAAILRSWIAIIHNWPSCPVHLRKFAYGRPSSEYEAHLRDAIEHFVTEFKSTFGRLPLPPAGAVMMDGNMDA